jgi:hypothetical protein
MHAPASSCPGGQSPSSLPAREQFLLQLRIRDAEFLDRLLDGAFLVGGAERGQAALPGCSRVWCLPVKLIRYLIPFPPPAVQCSLARNRRTNIGAERFSPRLAPLQTPASSKRHRRRVLPLFLWRGLSVLDLSRRDIDDGLGELGRVTGAFRVLVHGRTIGRASAESKAGSSRSNFKLTHYPFGPPGRPVPKTPHKTDGLDD